MIQSYQCQKLYWIGVLVTDLQSFIRSASGATKTSADWLKEPPDLENDSESWNFFDLMEKVSDRCKVVKVGKMVKNWIIDFLKSSYFFS